MNCNIFPLLDIRFIAVNNEYDSNDYMGEAPDMSVAFQNIVYDYFSEESSVKIKKELFGWVNSDSFRMRIEKKGAGSGKVPQEYDSDRYVSGIL